MGPSSVEKTLIFCTTYTPPAAGNMAADQYAFYYSWNVRYRLWLESIRRSALDFDQILMIDDGSQTLPEWNDLHIILEGDEVYNDAPIALYHFRERLGRHAVSDFPGWVRSFFFASHYAERNGFTRVVHIESDTFLITPKAIEAVNSAPDGWTAFWSDRYDRPESSIQVITGSALLTYRKWAQKPIDSFSGAVIETTLPFTRLEKGLAGGRYGEDELNWVPRTADWCMQARPTKLGTYSTYFWWMPWLSSMLPDLDGSLKNADLIDIEACKLSHGGAYYLDWLGDLSNAISPDMYFEIGTHTGSSLKMISSDAVCVDPDFKISSDVLRRRRNTHFFQGTSDEFFSDVDLVSRLFPRGIDLAFLDGLHLFENLLKDFINTERLTNPHSVIVLHDCLPFNERMAERIRRFGGTDEPEEIRDFWTGDVWKLLLILKKYRPELSLSYLDCPPTGLISCTNMNKTNTVLQDNYDKIITEFFDLSLSEYGIETLWRLYPMFDSRKTFSTSEAPVIMPVAIPAE